MYDTVIKLGAAMRHVGVTPVRFLFLFFCYGIFNCEAYVEIFIGGGIGFSPLQVVESNIYCHGIITCRKAVVEFTE